MSFSEVWPQEVVLIQIICLLEMDGDEAIHIFEVRQSLEVQSPVSKEKRNLLGQKNRLKLKFYSKTIGIRHRFQK